MALVYVVNYLDRQILGILAHPIKIEFHLTDFEVGILGGPAFAVVYAVLGIPLAIFADRLNRRNVIAASLAVFSFMTLMCGLAMQYWQLVLARFGTGVGEAGTSPSINSVLADLYPPEKRASALAFYSAGLNVGLLVAFFGGGWIAQHYGWRQCVSHRGHSGFAVGILVLQRCTSRNAARSKTSSTPPRPPACGPSSACCGRNALFAGSRSAPA
jgi:MFS family permease